MKKMRKKIFAAAGHNTMYFGSGRREFNPKKPMPELETYLLETAKGTCSQLKNDAFDEGIIANFMSARFLKQGNLPGFLPFMAPSLSGKPCSRVEGACGSGGLAIGSAIRSILSDLSDSVFVCGFEIQNNLKAVYGADILAGAGYIKGERKQGHAYFFPGVFSSRAGAYFEKYGREYTRKGMAKWYENAILNARLTPKAQEYHNKTENLFEAALQPPNPKSFVENLNFYDCSKVSDGASSLIIASEEGLKKLGILKKDAVEICAFTGAEGDITQKPVDETDLNNTAAAAQKALAMAAINTEHIGLLELHDCFSITGLIALESIGFVPKGEAPGFVHDKQIAATGSLPVNLSGGLVGFGHPTGATGVRQLVDLIHQFTGKADNQVSLKKPFGMMISMGGNDKTVSSVIVKKTE